jgi:hypothetical protein
VGADPSSHRQSRRKNGHAEQPGGGDLYWSDAFMSDRQARGERWKFNPLAELAVSRPWAAMFEILGQSG